MNLEGASRLAIVLGDGLIVICNRLEFPDLRFGQISLQPQHDEGGAGSSLELLLLRSQALFSKGARLPRCSPPLRMDCTR